MVWPTNLFFQRSTNSLTVVFSLPPFKVTSSIPTKLVAKSVGCVFAIFISFAAPSAPCWCARYNSADVGLRPINCSRRIWLLAASLAAAIDDSKGSNLFVKPYSAAVPSTN